MEEQDDPDICGAKTRDGSPCARPAGWGTDSDSGRCKQHGGLAGAPENNTNAAKHLAFSEMLTDDLSDKEEAAIEEFSELVAGGDVDGVVAEVAGVALVRYVRSGDPRHAAEFRRQLETFNVVENAKEVDFGGLLADFRD